MSNKFTRIVCYFLASLLFLLGLAVFVYPLVNRSLIKHNTEERLKGFNSVREESINTEVSESRFSQLYYDMVEYNERICEEGQQGLKDAWSYEQSGFNLTEYGVYNGIVAQLRIPEMDCVLPVYMGATNANMALGAAQLGQTSAPVGGVNTNCVLAAHRGAAGGEFFLYIEKLEVGDKVYVDNLWETLTYKVVDTEVINPDEISKVLIKEGKDMLTLVTCHPYPSNSQRYVVYCCRDSEVSTDTDYAGNNTEESSKPITGADGKISDSSSDFIRFELALYIIIPVLLLVLTIVLFTPFRKNRKDKSSKNRT